MLRGHCHHHRRRLTLLLRGHHHLTMLLLLRHHRRRHHRSWLRMVTVGHCWCWWWRRTSQGRGHGQTTGMGHRGRHAGAGWTGNAKVTASTVRHSTSATTWQRHHRHGWRHHSLLIRSGPHSCLHTIIILVTKTRHHTTTLYLNRRLLRCSIGLWHWWLCRRLSHTRFRSHIWTRYATIEIMNSSRSLGGCWH